MDLDFHPSPHEAAAKAIESKPALAKSVWKQLLPELRVRAFTVANVESTNVLQAIRDEAASLPRGTRWDGAKSAIQTALEPYLGEGAEWRAEMIMRVNCFQAFSADSWRTAQADEATTALQYLHGDCKVPTPSHLALNGVILPKNDPFWETHTGPWGHIGCVCYFRTMSDDQVADEKKADENRDPADRLVMEGPARTKLNEGTLVRSGRAYDVSAPSDTDAFHWHPDDMTLRADQLQAKYDPEIWREFVKLAKAEKLADNVTLWDWINEPSYRRRTHDLPIVQEPKSFATIPEARAWAAANMHPDKLGLSDAEREALIDNQHSSAAVNEMLIGRRDPDPELTARVRRLDAAIAKSEVKEPLVVWRGASSHRWDNLQAGEIREQQAFVSTTLAEQQQDFKEHAWIKIHVPAGTKAIYMDKLDQLEDHADEAELLLARKIKLKILSVAKREGVTYIEAEIV